MTKETINIKEMIGKEIKRYLLNDKQIIFYTDDEQITIERFIPYCVCNVGEYIDEIIIDNDIFGTITSINTNITYKSREEYDTPYTGEVTFYFENKKINMQVHGEDNGYYGVSFTMPATIERLERE